MPMLSEHPTVKRFLQRNTAATRAGSSRKLEPEWLRQLCLDAGADDVGFVEIERPEIAEQRSDIQNFFPRSKTLISFVCRMNREPIRSTARSVANLEFHHAGDRVNDVARRIVTDLDPAGVSAINPAMGFPMEMDRFGQKTWVVSHKPIAVAAGLGHMGIHRNVIHPRFGNFIMLGTVLIDAEVTKYQAAKITIRVWSANYAYRPVPSGPLGQTARSTSPPAIPTTIASSWVGAPIGLERSPTAKTPKTIAAR
jgi:hypothetical protein